MIDGPPRVAGLMCSALLAAGLVLTTVQPSPLDGSASVEMLAPLSEASIYRPELRARSVLNRCGARTIIGRETAETLADHDPPVLRHTIGQRVIYADKAQSGRLAFEVDDRGPAAREVAALITEIERIARCERANPGAVCGAPTNPDAWIRATEADPPRNYASTFSARLAIDITPEPCGCIEIAAFQHGVTGADMLREPLAREFPATSGDPS